MKRPCLLVHCSQLVAYCLLLLSSTTVFAQAPASTPRDYIVNHMFWGNVVLAGKIKGKFDYQVDLEYRTQADPNHSADSNTTVGSDHYNIFKHPYQYAIRPWIHYQPNKTLRFSISPLTWFGSWQYPVNGVTYYQPEYRTAGQVTVYNALGRVLLDHRYRFEYRWFGLKKATDNPDNPTGPAETYDFLAANEKMRFRYRLRANILLNSKAMEVGTIYIMCSSEIFLQLGTNVANTNVFDQNRCYLGLGYKLSPLLRTEVGFFNQLAFRFNNKAKNNVDVNNAIFVNLIFDDFNRLFKKKEKVITP